MNVHCARGGGLSARWHIKSCSSKGKNRTRIKGFFTSAKGAEQGVEDPSYFRRGGKKKNLAGGLGGVRHHL